MRHLIFKMNRKRSIVLTNLLLSFISLPLFGQMNIIETVQYINKTFSDYKSEINVSDFRFIKEGIQISRVGSEIKINGHWPDDKIKFDIRNVTINKVYTTGIIFSGVNNIQYIGKLKSSFIINCGNVVNRDRIYNAFLHLQELTSLNYISAAPKDPFDYKADEYYSPFLEIQNIRFVDQNNNNRIDNNEQILILFEIENSGKRKAENVTLKIINKNSVKGLSFNSVYSNLSVFSNNKIEVKIPIKAGSDLEINQAVLEIIVYLDKELVAKSNISIATFNSLDKDYSFSKLPDIDINIPKTNRVSRNTYAIVIGNNMLPIHRT